MPVVLAQVRFPHTTFNCKWSSGSRKKEGRKEGKMEEGKGTGETKAAILQAGFKSHSVGFLNQRADIISA